MRFQTKLHAFAASLAIALLGIGVAVPAAGAIPAKFWGVVPQLTPNPERLQRLKRGGVDSMRVPISWPAIQQQKGGPFDWSGVDGMIGDAASAGIEVLPFLTGAPTWAVPQVGIGHGAKATKNLPVRTGLQRSGWKNFVRQAVLRYGSAGSYWAEHPEVPRRPVRTWQIWNEANFFYFVARPNPAEYGKLVKLSSAAAKSADHKAKLLLGGLFSHPIQATSRRKPKLAYFAGDFLRRMYKSTPGIKAKFDGVALHPYTSNYKRLKPYVEEVRKAMKESHDAGTGLYVTELSWSSDPPRGNNFGKGLKGQAAQLKGAFGLLKRNASRWRIKGVYWFSVDDQAGTCNFCSGSGLFKDNGAPKPSWYAYVHFAGGHP